MCNHRSNHALHTVADLLLLLLLLFTFEKEPHSRSIFLCAEIHDEVTGAAHYFHHDISQLWSSISLITISLTNPDYETKRPGVIMIVASK